MPQSQRISLRILIQKFSKKLKVTEKKNALILLEKEYENIKEQLLEIESDDSYSLSQFTFELLCLAKEEVAENNKKYLKDRKTDIGFYNTPLLDFSCSHLINCCRNNINQKQIKWINFILILNEFDLVKMSIEIEQILVSCVYSCTLASKMESVDYASLKKLWDHILFRISDKLQNPEIMHKYVLTLLHILKTVNIQALEKSPYQIVKKVVSTMKNIVDRFGSEQDFWKGKRRVSFTSLLLYFLEKWGLEARDYILINCIDQIDFLSKNIKVDVNDKTDSRVMIIYVIDKYLQLVIIDKECCHVQTLDQVTKNKIENLLKTRIDLILKDVHSLYLNRNGFKICQEYIKIFARWISIYKTLKNVGNKGKEEFDLNWKKHMTLEYETDFPNSINKCNAANFIIEILNEIVQEKGLKKNEIEKIIDSLWMKRKRFSTDSLRSSFCLFLTSVITNYQNIKFGAGTIPSIDIILKYALTLLPNIGSLSKSAQLVEQVLRCKSKEVTKEMIELICDMISKLNQSSNDVLKIISALISYLEFDENVHFCRVNNNQKRLWTFRKDIIDWLLLEPNSNCTKLLIQLCQYCPSFCYEIKSNENDYLIERMKRCHLRKTEIIETEKHNFLFETPIDEIVQYIQNILLIQIDSEVNVEVFVIFLEFSNWFNLSIKQFNEVFIKKIDEILNNSNKNYYLQLIKNVTKWSSHFKFIEKFNSSEILAEYFRANIENSSFDFDFYLNNNCKDVLDVLLEKKMDLTERRKFQESENFNKLVIKFIISDTDDVYKMTWRYQTFSWFLSYENLFTTRIKIQTKMSKILKETNDLSTDEVRRIENLTASTCVRNVVLSRKLTGSQFDPHIVCEYPQNIFFDHKNLFKFLKKLKNSPFLAQNLVRHILMEPSLDHLHIKTLKYLLITPSLLMVCIATIPNIKTFFKIYQVNFCTKQESITLLNLNVKSIKKCQEYIKKPKLNSEKIQIEDLPVLFGYNIKNWARVGYCFWKLFNQNSSLVLEKLNSFAKESVKVGLSIRLLLLLKSIGNSEFSQNINHNKQRDVFCFCYQSIFHMVLENSKLNERNRIIEICWNETLKCDIIKNWSESIKLNEKYSSEIFNFENKMALEVERFLNYGYDDVNTKYENFGLIEFYNQLSDNLTEEVIKSCQCQEIYIIDFLHQVWNIFPNMKKHVVKIVARFTNISLAWQKFPQPNYVGINLQNFKGRLRFYCSLNLMKYCEQNSTKMKITAYALLYLLSYNYSINLKEYFESFEKLKKPLEQKNVFFKLIWKIKKIVLQEKMDDLLLFETACKVSSFFPNIAIFLTPFLFHLLPFNGEFENAVGLLLSLSKIIDKENKMHALCLAECIDSIGLNVISIFEKQDDSISSPYSTEYFFQLGQLFIKHGYSSHAFVISNLLFDRLSRNQRNLMIIERISFTEISKHQKIIDLLRQTYVFENNAVSLTSLPTKEQAETKVRNVIYKSSNEWLKLVSSELSDEKDFVFAQWMCGLKSDSYSIDQSYFDSILRCQFRNYPKIITCTSKFVYLILFHLSIPSTNEEQQEVFKNILSKMFENIDELKISDIRLIYIALGSLDFSPQTIEEHLVSAVRSLRDTTRRRLNREFEFFKKINKTTDEIICVAQMIASKKGFVAAQQLLKKWKDECSKWQINDIDINLIEINQYKLMYNFGEYQMAESNLNALHSKVKSMSHKACAQYYLVLSQIMLEYKNEVELGMNALKTGCKMLGNSEIIESKLKLLLKFHSVCVAQLSTLEEYRESKSFQLYNVAIESFEEQIRRANRAGRCNIFRCFRLKNSVNRSVPDRTVARVRKENQCAKEEVDQVNKKVKTAAINAVMSAIDALDSISQLKDEEYAIRKSTLIIFPLIDIIYKYENISEIESIINRYSKNGINTKLWLCATSHIASKLFSNEKSALKESLGKILTQMVIDYPFHILHILLMYEYQMNGSIVRKFIDSIPSKIIENLSQSQKLKEIIKDMRNAHCAYREMALYDTKKLQMCSIDGKKGFELPKELKILKCPLSRLPIPTITQKIGEAGDYSVKKLITWKSYQEVFFIADGLSAPKVWEIKGSDEKWYKTVWKKDDVRQDVLVEQMFVVTNKILDDSVLRTYNIVPLDTECGIIEFCGGTVSLKELLCGTNRDGGIHKKYFPGEESAMKVTLKMKECQRESAEKRRSVFVDICKEYSPVFRHFFYNSFPTTHVWREKIDDYRKSLATWSIVCYIVGLGDRHASNILFDEKNCSFVHIDLGMILEYSKRTLPIPEQVPFRLSRDLIDPILIEGIENGQLVDICTQMMMKLRENQKVILGVASALLRETMSNFEETEVANGRPSHISEMAIGRLRNKLRGTEGTLKTENMQVRSLLKEATNADNLSRMFCGWMPFL